MLIKAAVCIGFLMLLAPPLTWVERRGSAMIQDRIGPNRAALFGKIKILGMAHVLADGLKFFLKRTLFPRMLTVPFFGSRLRLLLFLLFLALRSFRLDEVFKRKGSLTI